MALHHLKRGEPRLAIHEALSASDRSPHWGGARLVLAWAQGELNNVEESRQNSEMALAAPRHPIEEAPFHYLAGQAARARGDHSQAQQHFQTVLQAEQQGYVRRLAESALASGKTA